MNAVLLAGEAPKLPVTTTASVVLIASLALTAAWLWYVGR
jgi:hypothetical protein